MKPTLLEVKEVFLLTVRDPPLFPEAVMVPDKEGRGSVLEEAQMQTVLEA